MLCRHEFGGVKIFTPAMKARAQCRGFPQGGGLSGERRANAHIGFHTHTASENLKPSPTILTVCIDFSRDFYHRCGHSNSKNMRKYGPKTCTPFRLVLTVENSESLHDCSIICVIMWPEISAVLGNAFSQRTAKTGTYCSLTP